MKQVKLYDIENDTIEIVEEHTSRTERREKNKKSNKIWSVVLYILTALHLGLLVFYFIDKNQFIGFNLIFPVPNVIFSFCKGKNLLFVLNIIMFSIGLVILITRINGLLIK